MPDVKKSLERNLQAVGSPEFVSDVLAELRLNRVKTLRIHVAGDFMSVEYIQKWLEIVERAKRVTFFAYTRSWQDVLMCPWLVRLARMSNFRMFWSADRDTHNANRLYPPAGAGRVAYMVVSPQEPIPEYVDLVFRVYRGSVEKYKDGRLVCPAEQGVKPARGPKITCSACGLCFADKAIRRKSLVQLQEA